MEYMFRFLTEREAAYKDENIFWFRVGDILNIIKPFEVNHYLVENQLKALKTRRRVSVESSV